MSFRLREFEDPGYVVATNYKSARNRPTDITEHGNTPTTLDFGSYIRHLRVGHLPAPIKGLVRCKMNASSYQNDVNKFKTISIAGHLSTNPPDLFGKNWVKGFTTSQVTSDICLWRSWKKRRWKLYRLDQTCTTYSGVLVENWISAGHEIKSNPPPYCHLIHHTSSIIAMDILSMPFCHIFAILQHELLKGRWKACNVRHTYLHCNNGVLYHSINGGWQWLDGWDGCDLCDLCCVMNLWFLWFLCELVSSSIVGQNAPNPACCKFWLGCKSCSWIIRQERTWKTWKIADLDKYWGRPSSTSSMHWTSPTHP